MVQIFWFRSGFCNQLGCRVQGCPNGSGFANVAPHFNLSTMAWRARQQSVEFLVDKEMKSFASPYPTVRVWSDSRPIWYARWGLPDSFPVWLLALEDEVTWVFLSTRQRTIGCEVANRTSRMSVCTSVLLPECLMSLVSRRSFFPMSSGGPLFPQCQRSQGLIHNELSILLPACTSCLISFYLSYSSFLFS